MIAFKRVYLALGWVLLVGCATWKPSGEQPPPIRAGIQTAPLSSDSVAIETIVIRLTPEQTPRLEELWRLADEQILTPDQRLLLDDNGVRVGKLSIVPPVLETWIREIGERQSQDTMEQTGLAADVKTMSYHLRCRANTVKEILLRDLSDERVTIFYNQDGFKGKQLERPRFLFKLKASPESNADAKIRLSPEIVHGELRSKVVVRDAALRNVSEREFMSFPELDVQSNLKVGELLVLGPTAERKGIGAEFFHSLTHDNKHQPVLILLRVSQTGVDSTFGTVDSQ